MTEAGLYLRILRLPGVGSVGLRMILARLAQIGVNPENISDLDDDQLSSNLNLNPEQIVALRNPISDVDEDLKQCAEMGIETILTSDARFPGRIFSIMGRSSPVLLFARGNLDLLRFPALGISGSRHASESGLSGISALCSEAARGGWVIVSGGARGVDEAAHLAALRQGSGTIVVMPTGLLKPNFRAEFSRHLDADKSLLISEFPPKSKWTPGCAMQRNRLLAALSRVVIIAEPGLRGGTGGTGRTAIKMKIPMFIMDTVSGDPTASNELTRTGARRISPFGWKTGELPRYLHQTWEESEIAKSRIKIQTILPVCES